MGKLMVGRARFLFLSAVVLVCSTLALPTTALAQIYRVTINPIQGSPGTSVTGTGTNWIPSDSMQVIWDDASQSILANTTVRSEGTFSVSFNVPSNASAGAHTIRFTDIGSQHTPFGLPVDFTVGQTTGALIDLSPTAIQYSPADLVPGKTVLFDSGVRNSGSQGTGVFNVRWFVDDVSVGYGSHEGVPANTTMLNGNSQFSWVATAGTHTIKFAVDVDNHVVESNESNNSTSVRVTVTSAQDCTPLHPESGLWYVMGHQCFTAVGAYAKMSQHQPLVAIEGVHSLAEVDTHGLTPVVLCGLLDSCYKRFQQWSRCY